MTKKSYLVPHPFKKGVMVSRQRLWQIKKQQANACPSCGKKKEKCKCDDKRQTPEFKKHAMERAMGIAQAKRYKPLLEEKDRLTKEIEEIKGKILTEQNLELLLFLTQKSGKLCAALKRNAAQLETCEKWLTDEFRELAELKSVPLARKRFDLT